MKIIHLDETYNYKKGIIYFLSARCVQLFTLTLLRYNLASITVQLPPFGHSDDTQYFGQQHFSIFAILERKYKSFSYYSLCYLQN